MLAALMEGCKTDFLCTLILLNPFAKLTIVIICIVTFQGLGKTLQCITLIWTLLVRTMNYTDCKLVDFIDHFLLVYSD